MGVYSYLVGAQKIRLNLANGEVAEARNLSFAFKLSFSYNDKEFKRLQALRLATAKRSWERLGPPEYVVMKEDISKDPFDSYGVVVAYPWRGGYEWIDTKDLPSGTPKYFLQSLAGRKKCLSEISASKADEIVREGLINDIVSGKRKRHYFDEELSKMSPIIAFEEICKRAKERGEKYVYLREEGML